MKARRILMGCIICFLSVACQGDALDAGTSIAIPESGTPMELPTGIALDPFSLEPRDRSVFEIGLIRESQSALQLLTESTIYQMDWVLSDDLGTLEGKVKIHYTNREQDPLEELYLRLYPNLLGGQMIISDLTIDGQTYVWSQEQEDSLLQIDLAQVMAPGESILIETAYRLNLPREIQASNGHYGLFGSFNGLLVLEEAYPILLVFDEQGWDLDVPVAHGDLTHLDVSFYQVRIGLPAEIEVAASGVLLDHKTEGDRQTLTFAAGPARDFYFSAGDFQPASCLHGETIINTYLLPGTESALEAVQEISKQAFSSFSNRLGAYPYTEFDIVSTPMLALGMEYPGIVTLNRNMFDADAEIAGLPGTVYLEGTLVHEIAHQWYYNLVGNDQLEAPWLDEAIVQYITGVYFLDTYGTQGYQEFRDSWMSRWDRVEQEPTPIGLPARNYDGRAYGAIVYGRGPLFVEALAQEMGTETFWEFLRAYTDTYAWEIAQPADFILLAESACSCELDSIWETWGVYP